MVESLLTQGEDYDRKQDSGLKISVVFCRKGFMVGVNKKRKKQPMSEVSLWKRDSLLQLFFSISR